MAASFNNIEKIKSHFIKMGHPYFLISEDKKTIFAINSTENDIELAAELLEEALEDKDHTKPYHIYCFDKVLKGGLQIPTKASNVIYFSYQRQRPEYSGEQKSQYYGGVYDLIRRQDEKIDKLTELLAAQNQVEEVEEEEVKDSMQNNFLGAILGNPAVQNIIANLLTNITANVVTNQAQNNMQTQFQRPTHLAGADLETTELDIAEILETLFDKGVTIEHLRKLASYPKAKITMLLTML